MACLSIVVVAVAVLIRRLNGEIISMNGEIMSLDGGAVVVFEYPRRVMKQVNVRQT
jgi:hypothetical protein